MTNEALKQAIESNTLTNDILILKYSDTKYICNQYIDAICKNRNLTKKYVNSIYDCEDNSFFEVENEYLYVLDVDKLSEIPDNSFKDLVIITKDVPTNLPVDYVDMCKIVDWQIIDYVKSRIKGLGDSEIQWLCKVCKYNIDRLNQECNKLELFPEATQKLVFEEMNRDNCYSDLTDDNIFLFCNAIEKKDYQAVGQLIPEINEADLEPLGCVTILLKKFRKMVDFLMNPKATAASCGMSEKQFYFLKKHPDKFSPFTEQEIIKNIKFLTNIDYQIKSGNLEFSRDRLLDYIVTNIL